MRIRFPDMEETYIKFYNGEPSKEGLKYLDYRSEMDSQDPPLYIYNPINSQDYINSEGTIDFNVLYHSFRHGDYLREKAIEVEQEFSGAYLFIKRSECINSSNIELKDSKSIIEYGQI